MDHKEKAKEIVSKMTLNEKARICSGGGTWRTEAIGRVELPAILMTDGPHGIRKQIGKADNLGINISAPATCFPTAATTANSFDRSLLREIGIAIAEEALKEKISIVLGPGVNIKRSPLCGRNFEYISEDPYVSGELACEIIDGIQSLGVGVSLKHFAANNQEQLRMVGNSVVDERALREIYLSAFEIAVGRTKPWTVMCSYNQVNGVFSSENKYLLTDILRDEWGFDGVVISDWNAVNDRVAGLEAGLDLEMPASGGFNDRIIARAVRRGKLKESTLNKTAERLVELALKADTNLREYTFSEVAHHNLARRAQAESAVLLKNANNILPLKKGARVAIIGEFAKKPRYQGAGSSRINPTKLDNPVDELIKLGVHIEYTDGHNPEEVKKLASDCDVALVFAGLTDKYESEGFDRSFLDLPQAHNEMIFAVAEANPNTIVVLQCGAPVGMPWKENVRGILLAYLGGQAGGGGIADLLTGTRNPSGKLAESFPLCLEDTPCFGTFSNGKLSSEYRESIFVGYRYYDTVEKPVAFPFGFGLSYTNFEYSDFSANANTASVLIKNTGKCAGAEIVQLYISGPKNTRIFRASHELKGFEKVFLQPGESRLATFQFTPRSFSYYNPDSGKWSIENGEYTISAAASSRDIRASVQVQISDGDEDDPFKSLKKTIYYHLPPEQLNIPSADFEALYGKPLPPCRRNSGVPFDANCTLEDIKGKWIGRMLTKIVGKMSDDIYDKAGQEQDDGFRRMAEAMRMETPLRAFGMMSGGLLPPARLDALLLIMNGKVLKGILKLLKQI
jgi:beta-glucosidase